jgi:nucleoside-diphosphate kinase
VERTLVLLKPDAVARRLIGLILNRFENKGLCLVGLKVLQVPEDLAGRHYAVHRDKPFYPGLIEFLTSGPTVAACLAGRNAVTVARQMVGATDCGKAAPGSIRGDLGMSQRFNLVHASDSVESAAEEIGNFFTEGELCEPPEGTTRWIYDVSAGELI